jgi:hypothetical protein
MLLTLAFKQAQPVEYDWQAWPSSPFSQHESFGAATVEWQRKVSHYLQPILSHRFLNNLA